MLKVGIVGVGSIGSEICRAIDEGLVQAELVGISDIDPVKAENLAHSLRRPVPVMPVAEVIEASELVVEAASKAVAPAIVRNALVRSRDILAMSVGGSWSVPPNSSNWHREAEGGCTFLPARSQGSMR